MTYQGAFASWNDGPSRSNPSGEVRYSGSYQERGLTPRSSGAPTAGHQARAGGTRYIFASPGLATCRRRPLSSNVRHRKHTLRALVALKTRVQLSLFVPPLDADRLENARHQLDPVQAKLIPAHVTLCREDELQDFDFAALGTILGILGAWPLTLSFGSPEVFQGHGVLLPCIEGEEAFHELRCCLLCSRTVRHHAPHITIAHPRNPRSPHNVSTNFDVIPTGLVITFGAIQYIAQEEHASWQVVGTQSLLGAARSDA
jgi:hypothetical protein